MLRHRGGAPLMLGRRNIMSGQRVALLQHSQQAARAAARFEMERELHRRHDSPADARTAAGWVDLHTARVFEGEVELGPCSERAPLNRRALRDVQGEDPGEELPAVRPRSWAKPKWMKGGGAPRPGSGSIAPRRVVLSARSRQPMETPATPTWRQLDPPAKGQRRGLRRRSPRSSATPGGRERRSRPWPRRCNNGRLVRLLR